MTNWRPAKRDTIEPDDYTEYLERTPAKLYWFEDDLDGNHVMRVGWWVRKNDPGMATLAYDFLNSNWKDSVIAPIFPPTLEADITPPSEANRAQADPVDYMSIVRDIARSR